MSDGVQEIQWPWESSWCWRTPSRTQELWNGVYDKLRRGWAGKSHRLLRTTRRSAAHKWHILMSIETKMKLLFLVVSYHLAGLYTSRAVKLCSLRMRLNTTWPRGSSSERELATDPGKVAADMRTSRNPVGSRMFERKDWLTKSQVQGFVSVETSAYA